MGRQDPDRGPRVKRYTGSKIRRTIELLEARDGNRCCLCRIEIDTSLPGNVKLGPTIEHRIPIELGGTNALDNLALAHLSCNARRGARDPDVPLRTSRTWIE